MPTPSRMSEMNRNSLLCHLKRSKRLEMNLLNKGPPKHADMPMSGNPRLAEKRSATKSFKQKPRYKRFVSEK